MKAVHSLVAWHPPTMLEGKDQCHVVMVPDWRSSASWRLWIQRRMAPDRFRCMRSTWLLSKAPWLFNCTRGVYKLKCGEFFKIIQEILLRDKIPAILYISWRVCPTRKNEVGNFYYSSRDIVKLSLMKSDLSQIMMFWYWLSQNNQIIDIKVVVGFLLY